MLRRGWDAWCVFWARARRNRNENENEPRQGGGASASKKLLAAIAVLAVAFVVFAAIPVAVDDSEAATEPVYYDATIEKDDATASTYKTLEGAINAAGENGTVILKTDVKATEATGGIFTISKAVTIKSADSKDKKDLPFGIKTTYSLTLQNVTLSPAENMKLLRVDGSAVNIDIEYCDINVNGGKADARGDGIEIGSAASVAIKNNTFYNVTSGHYVRAMFISNVSENVDIISNTATGFHVFAALHSVSTTESTVTTVKDNKSYEMTGDFKVGSETKDSKFLQIAGDKGSNVVVKDNTVDAKAGVAAIPYVNIHDGGATVASLTVDKDMTVNGPLKISKTVEVGGLITVEKFDDKQGTITINTNSTLIVNGGMVGEKGAIITNNGTLFNNSNITLSKEEGSTAKYKGNGEFVAGAGSTATFNIEGTEGKFVGTGKINNEVPTTGGKENNNKNLAGAATVTDINNYLEAGMDVSFTNQVTPTEKDVIVNSGSALTGEFKYAKSGSETADNIVSVYNLVGEYKIQKGSVAFNGSIKEGTIYATGGVNTLSGTITGDVYLVIASGATVQVDGTLNIIAGATLYITDLNADGKGFSVPMNSSLNLFGSIRMYQSVYIKGYNASSTSFNPGTLYVDGNGVPSKTTDTSYTEQKSSTVIITVDKKTGTVATDKDGSFKAFSGSGISGVTVAGKGSIDLSQAQSPQTVGEDISYDKTYGQLEDVTIVGSLTIKNNSVVTVMGGFNVNENVTLTIEKGSKLIINSVAASMVVDGRIIVEEGATLEVQAAKDVKVSGSIESEGKVYIDSNVTVKSNGFIHINDATVGGTATAPVYASTFEVKSGLTIEAGAELVIKSKIVGVTKIDNKGSVVLNGAVLGGTLDINMLADSAVVDIQSVTGTSAVIITDEELMFTKTDGVTDKNTVTFTPGDKVSFKGLTVTEKVTSYVYNEKTYYTNTFEFTGAVTFTNESGAVAKIISVTGKNLSVPEKLDLGKGVTMAVGADSILKVAGTITATATGSVDADKSVITSAGDIQVTGLIQTATKITSGISAAMYETKTGTTPIYNYTTLNAAIAAAAKDIQVLGTISVLESATIPAGTTVKLDNAAKIIVGSDDNTDVVLTVADTGSIKNGTVVVKGTLVFDNKKDNRTVVVSDVSVIGEKEARYTNIYTALAQANPGDTVTIDRNKVELKKSITIKDGVTLDVPLTKKLIVSEGITITVVGTLKTAEKIEGAEYEENGTPKKVGFALEPSVREHKATIVVSGTFMSMADVKYDYYFVPGAYYQNTDSAGVYNYVTTLENASKSTAVSVTVYGKVTAGDVVFAGTTATRTLNVADGAELAATSITLDKAKFVATGRFSGDVKVGDSAVTAKFATFDAKINDDGMLTVDNIKKKISGNEKASFKVSAGTVNVKNSAFGITVSAGATLAADATAITGKLTIDGTVTVDNGKTMSVSGDVIVNGTLTVAEITDTKAPGTFTLSDTALLYIGITEDDIKSTGADASVSGTITAVRTAFVKAGANVSEATIDSFKVGDKLVSTTYVVEGKDWMTVYDRTSEYVIKNVNKAPVENAKFKQWLNTDGKAVDNSVIGASKCDKVTAYVDYEIYDIVINPAAGIESIAVDGNLMIKHSETGMYRMTVKAGTHEITCKLANGYSGDAQFSLVKSEAVADGTFNASVSGNKVTVSGDSGTVTVQITGVSASGYVDPTPVVPEEKDDGMSLTDILLIVLVVLIVIMAVIVAMRLMRS